MNDPVLAIAILGTAQASVTGRHHAMTDYARLEHLLRARSDRWTGAQPGDLTGGDLDREAADAIASLTKERDKAEARALEWFKVAQMREPVTDDDVAWATSVAVRLGLSTYVRTEE